MESKTEQSTSAPSETPNPNGVAAPSASAIPDNSPPPLTFVVPATTKDDATHFAVTTFPASYEEATVVASRILARYLTDPRPENLVLKCSIKDRSGDWAWADIDPLNWKFILGHCNNEVGVFEQRAVDDIGDLFFLHGRVYLTVKYTRCAEVQWSDIWSPDSTSAIGHPTMDRPKNFTEAVEYVKARLQGGAITSYDSSVKSQAEALISGDASKFRFYSFNKVTSVVGRQSQKMTLHTWTKFPPIAYTDAQVWRGVIPAPGLVLGVGYDEN